MMPNKFLGGAPARRQDCLIFHNLGVIAQRS